MFKKHCVSAFSTLAILLSINTVSAQVTFNHDQELLGEASDDLFGWSVDLSGDGNTIIVGAIGNNAGFANTSNNGHARVYRNTFNVSFNSWSWVLLGQEINATASAVESGYDVGINYDGNTIVIGTPGQDRMRVYDLNVSDNWSPRTSNGYNIFSSQNPQRAGHSVSINASGNVAAMGAPLGNKVWIFDIEPDVGTGLMSGNPLVVPGTYAGGSIDLDDEGNTIVVGAYKSNSERGQVLVYDFIGANWVQRGQILSGVNNYDQFGFDVSMSNDGNTIAVGSKGWDSNPNNTTYEIGETAVYDWDGSSWVQRGSSIQGVNFFDQCGFSVSLSGNGNRMAIGYKGSNEEFTAGGLVRIFDWNGNAWVQNGDPIYGDGINVYSGHSVGLSDNGSILAIGAIQGTGPINEFTNQQGQVRIYEGECLVSTAAVTQSDNVLTAIANASYQWIDCNNGNQPIPSATGQVFVAQSPGNYAVQITENGCTQTSACFEVIVTSLESETESNFSVFPNPTNNFITVKSDQFIQELQVMDVAGKSVLTVANSNSADLSLLAAGLYYLTLQFDNGSIGHVKVMKY
jgi:hypothetical protein